MSEGLMKSVDADIESIPFAQVKGSSERDRAMKLFAHGFLRLWTRLALESGQRLKMAPSQYVLGNYEGHMRWSLNENVDYKGIAHIEMGATFRKKHALIGETYILKGDERARLFFSLEQEKVKERPVFVNYLVFDAPLAEFDIVKAFAGLKPILVGWIETMTSGEDDALWKVCKETLECVGI
jgi:hypothetical protein